MNKIQILGTITKDIELKYTQTGAAIASFSIAYNERYMDKNGQQVDKAMFFDVTAFNKKAEVLNQYFHKGSRILIDGSLDYQTWTAQDGTNRSKVGIKLNNFDFIDRKQDTQPQQQIAQAPNGAPVVMEQPTPTQNQQGAFPTMKEGDIPFCKLGIA